MARALHVRLDDESEQALAVLRPQAASDSDAVRLALRETAARRRSRTALMAEVAALAANVDDREEMAAIRAQMAELAPDATR